MNWKNVKISDVSFQVRGVSYKPEDVTDINDPEGIPILRATNITDQGLNYDELVFVKKKRVSKDQLLKEGDIVIAASSGSKSIVGKAAYFSNGLTASFGAFCKVVRSKSDINPKFLSYYFQSKEYRQKISTLSAGANINNLRAEHIDDLSLILPPENIQQRIVAILDCADAIRQKDQQLLTKYDKLLDSLFYNFFGDPVKNEKEWNIVKLGSVCDVGSSKRVFVDELVEDGIPFFRGTEIGSLSVGEIITPSLFITQEHYDRLKADTGVPKIGDLLLPSICPDGRIYEVSDDNPFYFKDGRVLWIKMNSDVINGAFLKTCLKQIFATDYLKIASGTTFAELKIFELKKMETILPPISLQNKFASVIKNIEEQKRLANQQIQKSEKLFHSLLQKAFKGELVKEAEGVSCK